MSPLPSLTVVVPCRNAEAHIGETLDSILSQGYPDLELIVMDGGSTDGTLDIVRRHEAFLSWQSGPDGGPYAAICAGFARARGEILAWLNADDYYLPRALRVVGQMFSQLPEVAWTSSRFHLQGGPDGRIIHVHRHAGFSQAAFLDGCFLPHRQNPLYRACIQQEATFWRRSLWDKAGGLSPDYPLAGDFALWAAFFRHAPLVAINTPLAVFRQHTDCRSKREPVRYLEEATVALERARLEANHVIPPTPANGLRPYAGKIAVLDRPDEWALIDYTFYQVDSVVNPSLADVFRLGLMC